MTQEIIKNQPSDTGEYGDPNPGLYQGQGAFAAGGIGTVEDPGAGVLGNIPNSNYGDTTGPNAVNPVGAPGGLLNPEQARRFIDYVWDATVLAQDGRRVTMRANTIELEKVNVGERVIRSAAQALGEYTNAGATFTKVELTTKKIRLDWEVSTEALEDNIEGSALEDHLVRLMTNSFGNDLEDLAINGDTTSADPLLKALNGYTARARSAATVVDAAGANLTRSLFDKGLRNLPNKYLQRRSALSWYTSSSLLQDYLWSLSTTGTAGIIDGLGAPSPGSTLGDIIVNAGTGGASGGGNAVIQGIRPFGIALKEVPLYNETEAGSYSGAAGNHGIVELTFPNNRIWGIQRDVVIYREFKPKKDTIEYTQFIRVANQIENAEAYVHVKNVKVRSF